jgi:hypothetical protein
LAVRRKRTAPGRRIGVLVNFRSDEREGQARLLAFAQALQQLGWKDGGNLRTDTLWAGDDPDHYRKYAEELVALAPRRYPGLCQFERGGPAASKSQCTDRVCQRHRPGKCRLRC